MTLALLALAWNILQTENLTPTDGESGKEDGTCLTKTWPPVPITSSSIFIQCIDSSPFYNTTAELGVQTMRRLRACREKLKRVRQFQQKTKTRKERTARPPAHFCGAYGVPYLLNHATLTRSRTITSSSLCLVTNDHTVGERIHSSIVTTPPSPPLAPRTNKAAENIGGQYLLWFGQVRAKTVSIGIHRFPEHEPNTPLPYALHTRPRHIPRS
ncbi:unnamed protein product [Ectocarpus sp. 13 AM-2016]